MKHLLERELSSALQVRAFFAAFRDDALVVVCEQADGLRAADVDAKNGHYRYITVHDRPVWRRSRAARTEFNREGTLVIDGDRIVDIRPGATGATGAMRAMRATGATGALRASTCAAIIVLPGFIDVHVHGLEGIDTLDGGDAIAAIAQRLPKYGVTAFCPTTVACGAGMRCAKCCRASRRSAQQRSHAAARVLPAHLESNFINPDYRGAQPAGVPAEACGCNGCDGCVRSAKCAVRGCGAISTRRDILAEIDAAGDSVGIVTLAPELDGALDLIRHLVSRGRRVSLGHSGATLEQSRAAIAAGARHATHLFNRMPPLGHREPGLVGAILTSEEVAAEVICDGVHVHRDMVRMAIAAKGVDAHDGDHRRRGGCRPAGRIDGVARRPDDSRETESAAYLEDGTLAGSVATMDRVFRFLVNDVGLSLNDAAQLCATTPAAELGLEDTGTITKGAIADLVVLDRDLHREADLRRRTAGVQP